VPQFTAETPPAADNRGRRPIPVVVVRRRSMTGDRTQPIENLELNRETLADLVEEQAEQARGGKEPPYLGPPSKGDCEEIPM
jgi:hypothetical protein